MTGIVVTGIVVTGIVRTGIVRRLGVPLGLAALLVGVSPALAPAATKPVQIELTDAGCPKRLEVPAGTTEFEVKNVGADAVSEFEILDGHKVVAERENLSPGLSGSFRAALQPGTYTTYCPGGDREKGALVVTGAGAGGAASGTGKAATVAVTLSEYVVKAKPKSVKAGPVKLAVRNVGTMTHELVLVKTDGTPPTTEADGAVVEDGLPAGAFIGELEDLSPKVRTSMTETLAPGKYLLFCNIVDDDAGTMTSHYAEGMSTTITVR